MNSELKLALLSRINRIPIVVTLGLDILSFGDDFWESRVPRHLKYDEVFELYRGGLLITINNSTACFEILTRTGPETKLTTAEMDIRFFTSASPTSVTTGKARNLGL